MPLVSLLIVLIIGCVLIWAAQRLMAAFGIGDPIATVVYVFLVLLVVLWVLSTLGFGPGPLLRLR